jgi:hypothetical protein
MTRKEIFEKAISWKKEGGRKRSECDAMQMRKSDLGDDGVGGRKRELCVWWW